MLEISMPPALARPTLSPLPKGVTLGQVRARPEERLPSGSSFFDRLLGGGFPRGRLNEVFGAPSSGLTSLTYRTLAATTGRGEIAALVDCRERFDPRCGQAAGISLSRLLWVRPHDEREALRCAEILLGTERLGLVVLDLADGLPPFVAARFASAWPRLAHHAAASNVTLLLLSRQRLAGSFATVCIALGTGRPLWPRHALRNRIFNGIASRADVVRARGRSSVRLPERIHEALR
jgi:hypothetical protein